MSYFLNVDRFGNESGSLVRMRQQIPARAISAGVVTVLTGLIQGHNTHPSAWNNATGTFTAPTTGYYQIGGAVVLVGSWTVGSFGALDVFKNGVVDTRLFIQSHLAHAQMMTPTGSTTLFLNAGDTITMRVTSTVATNIVNNTTASYFYIDQL